MVKSPISYTGSKRRLLNQLMPHLPDSCYTFVDLFCGSGSVGMNYENAKTIWFNDNLKPLIDIFNGIKYSGLDSTLNQVEEIIKVNDLSKYNKENFYKYRDSIKYSYSWIELFVLMCFSYSNQMRFNKSGGYNSPFGEREFNDSTRKNLIDFCRLLENYEYFFTNNEFFSLLSDIIDLKGETFVYLDPPYFGSDTVYNNIWYTKEENLLYTFCNELDKNNIKFAISNNLQMNDHLRESNFIKKYNVINLNFDYKNCSYHREEKKRDSQEILITNY